MRSTPIRTLQGFTTGPSTQNHPTWPVYRLGAVPSKCPRLDSIAVFTAHGDGEQYNHVLQLNCLYSTEEASLRVDMHRGNASSEADRGSRRGETGTRQAYFGG